jgi:hypothetical protein
MMTVRLLIFSLISIVISPAALADGQIAGFVRNDQGRGLASITVILRNAGQTERRLTDAFGRYRFESLSSGDYQIEYLDENFIRYTDEDPYPDEGTIYLDNTVGQTIELQQDQHVDISDVVLQRVEPADDRQSSATVSNCETFGDGTDPQTLSHALESARDITISCSGTLPVPEVVIQRDVIITASNGLVFDALGENRVLRVLPGVSLEITGIDLTRGRQNDGSAIYNTGTASITDADIAYNNGNNASVFNRGVLNLRRVNQFSNIINYDSVFINTGVINGVDVTIDSHVASAGAVATNRGIVELDECVITGLGTNNVFSITNSAGATLKLFDCTITNSGSLFSNAGTLEIYDSSIDGNRGDQSLINSNGVLIVGGTGVTNNEVSGLVIFNAGVADILNSTISTNRAGFASVGDESVDSEGVVANEGLMRINSSTIAYNIHPGYGNHQVGNAGELQMSNTIVIGNGDGDECSGSAAVTSRGYNLQTDGTCNLNAQSDIPFGSTALLPLDNNGGLGKTHALQAASDAIDAGNCNDGTSSKDQRGVARPQGSGCDIGAYEREVAGEPESGTEDEPDSNEDDTPANEDNPANPPSASENENEPPPDDETESDAQEGAGGDSTEQSEMEGSSDSNNEPGSNVDEDVSVEPADPLATDESDGNSDDGQVAADGMGLGGAGAFFGALELWLALLVLARWYRRLVRRNG